MTGRLGNVLYWAACLVALGWIVISYFGTTTQKEPDWSIFWIIGMIPAFGMWIIGRALRYVLADR